MTLGRLLKKCIQSCPQLVEEISMYVKDVEEMKTKDKLQRVMNEHDQSIKAV